VYASSLIKVVRCHLGAAGAPLAPPAAARASLREVLAARLADPRKPRGIRHSLGSLVSVLVAGVACGYSSILAIAGAAAGWDQDVLAAHGTRRNPVTGLHEPPSASTLGRLPALLDADELEAGLSGCLAPVALDPALAARVAARAAAGKKNSGGTSKRRRKPPAGQALREVHGDGWFRAAPGHPWLDPAVTGDPGHHPARPAVGVDGKERKLAKAAGKKKVHLLGAVTHGTGLVIGQDKVAKAGKANETTHFKPLLEPLPLHDVLITADAMQATRENPAGSHRTSTRTTWCRCWATSPDCTPPSTPCPGRTPRSPPRPARSPAAGSRPAPSASCPPPKTWTSPAPDR